MTARTHDVAALCALTLAIIAVPLPTLGLSTVLLALLFNQIGGIVPDIDQPTAPLWRNLPIGHVLGRLVDRGLGGHRFLTHSLLGLALFGFLTRALLGYLSPLLHNANTGYIWWAFMLGMVSHLFMDTLTKEGVPWLLPIPLKLGLPPLKKLRVTTGTFAESFVVLPLLVALELYLLIHYQLHFTAIAHALH